MKVNLNDIKKFVIPDTTDWKLNPKYFKMAAAELGCENETPTVFDFILFSKLDIFTLSNIAYACAVVPKFL